MFTQFLDKAIEIATAKAIAKACGGITPEAVYQWKKYGQVPARHCLTIEALTDGQVTRYQLNPKTFGSDPKQASTVRQPPTHGRCV